MAGGGPRGGGGGDSAAAPSAAGHRWWWRSARRGSTFQVTVRIDKPQEWDEMFDDAWRCMKYRFYDAKLHGTDWDAMRNKYKPLVAFVADRQELMNVINEMIGELNASHTGASAGGGRGAGAVAGTGVMTRHLGLDLKPDQISGRYKVTHVFRKRPSRQRLDQGRQGELSDRDRRQTGQSWRRLQCVSRPPSQSKGRADVQCKASSGGLLDRQV